MIVKNVTVEAVEAKQLLDVAPFLDSPKSAIEIFILKLYVLISFQLIIALKLKFI